MIFLVGVAFRRFTAARWWLALLVINGLLGTLMARGALAQGRTLPALLNPDTVSQDDSHRLEAAYATLGEVSGQAHMVFDEREVTQELPSLVEHLQAIQHSVQDPGQVVDLKQVQMCELMLNSMLERLAEWRKALANSHTQLEAMRAHLAVGARLPAPTTGRDAGSRAVGQADSALQVRRRREERWVARRLERLHGLQPQVTVGYLQALELQDRVREQLRRFGQTTLAVTYPPLWEARPLAPLSPAPQAARYRREIIAYYFATNWDNWAYMAFIGAVFYGWVAFNYRRVRTKPAAQPAFRYLRPGPVAATLVVVFSLAPALELHPPPVYLDVLQGLLLLVLTVVFARSWPRGSFFYWLGLVGFCGALAVTNAYAAPGLLARWALLLLDGLGIVIGAVLLRRVRHAVALARFVGPIAVLFIGLNGLAIFCNMTGRLSLAKMFSTAAIFGLTQGIGLAVFIELFTEAFHLQILGSRLTASGRGHFNYAKIAAQLLRLLTVVAGGLWLLVFTSNLNLYGAGYSALARWLTAPHLLGSTTFTLGNILLFLLILFVSAQLQQYIGYFFGDVGEDDRAEARHRGSWLVGLRLLLVVVGFGLATAATGVALSKIAIVFGALSVGIGLGLQSVVNNLVSGIILLFERPFHVGDFIEVAGKSGRVQDIGIRSSKLTSVTGSEIIVPNGDLLSQHVINWTRTNDHVRVELVLKVAPAPDQLIGLDVTLPIAREQIQQEIKACPDTIHALPAEILLSSINGQVYELRVLFWVTDIRQQELTKSEILAGINRRFAAKGLQLS